MRIFDKVTNVQSITNIKQKGVLYPDEKIKFKKLGYFFLRTQF